jgi:MoxR-like ATPase
MIAAARGLALMRGRDYVLPQDVLDIAPDVLRHRLVLSYDALADGVPSEHVVHRVLQSVPLPQVTPRQRAAGGPYGSQGYGPSTGSTPAAPTPPPLPRPGRPAEQLSNGPGEERSA